MRYGYILTQAHIGSGYSYVCVCVCVLCGMVVVALRAFSKTARLARDHISPSVDSTLALCHRFAARRFYQSNTTALAGWPC